MSLQIISKATDSFCMFNGHRYYCGDEGEGLGMRPDTRLRAVLTNSGMSRKLGRGVLQQKMLRVAHVQYITDVMSRLWCINWCAHVL